jgi:N-acetylmuramoyl-L-alanine amidase
MFNVEINAGHGGKDPGCVHGPFYEKDINFAAALETYRQLKDSPIKRTLTREIDYPLSLDKSRDLYLRGMRGSLSNAYISLHCDSSAKTSPRGFSLYCNYDSPESINLANIIRQKYEPLSGIPCFGVITKVNSSKSDDYYGELRPIPPNIPALIFEMGFLSNEQDRKILTSPAFPGILANALKFALIEYFGYKEVYEEITRLNSILDEKRVIITKQSEIIKDLKAKLNIK